MSADDERAGRKRATRADEPAGDSGPAQEGAGQARATARRVRTWGIALGGAAAALLYGILGAGLKPGAPLLFFTAGGLGLALCALAMVRVVDPLLRPASAAARREADREPARLRELERDKQLVLKAIREIEHDYQMRKTSEADYKELSQRYRARAMRLMREIDAGDDFRALIEQELKARLAAAPPQEAK